MLKTTLPGSVTSRTRPATRTDARSFFQTSNAPRCAAPRYSYTPRYRTTPATASTRPGGADRLSDNANAPIAIMSSGHAGSRNLRYVQNSNWRYEKYSARSVTTNSAKTTKMARSRTSGQNRRNGTNSAASPVSTNGDCTSTIQPP